MQLYKPRQEVQPGQDWGHPPLGRGLSAKAGSVDPSQNPSQRREDKRFPFLSPDTTEVAAELRARPLPARGRGRIPGGTSFFCDATGTFPRRIRTTSHRDRTWSRHQGYTWVWSHLRFALPSLPPQAFHPAAPRVSLPCLHHPCCTGRLKRQALFSYIHLKDPTLPYGLQGSKSRKSLVFSLFGL